MTTDAPADAGGDATPSPEPGKRSTRTRNPRADARPRPPGRPSNDAKLAESLAQLVAMPGVLLSALPNPTLQADGRALIEGAERMGQALTEWAKTNASVRRVLEGLVTGGALGGVVVAAGGIALPILGNHGLIPPMFGMLAQAQAQAGAWEPDAG